MADPRPVVDEPGVYDVTVASERLTLPEFLRRCAVAVEHGAATTAEQAVAAAFVQGGLDAVRRGPGRSPWVQRGVEPASPAAAAELYGRVLRLTDGLLDARRADDAFFLHKPPGLRLRFAAAGDRDEVERLVDGELARWRADGVVGRVVPGVYEPESALFGGPGAMGPVHRLFTHDSRAWLAYHALPGAPAVAPWTLSLVLLRDVLTALDVTGWEDRGVWEQVRDATGRSLSAAARETDGFAGVAAALRAAWRSGGLRDALPPAAGRIADEFRDAAAATATAWLATYFRMPGATQGPRRSAAFYVVFHWNRAGLPPHRQALLAESMAGGDDD